MNQKLIAGIVAVFAFGILSGAVFAGSHPARQEQASTDDLHKEFTSFNNRVEYARSHGKLAAYSNKGGLLTCSVYRVKTGPKNGPGYTLVVAREKSGGILGDIEVLSDTVAIEPAHSIKCKGHVLVIMNGFFMKGAPDTTAQLGLGKGDGGLKIDGQHHSTQIN